MGIREGIVGVYRSDTRIVCAAPFRTFKFVEGLHQLGVFRFLLSTNRAGVSFVSREISEFFLYFSRVKSISILQNVKLCIIIFNNIILLL